VSDGQNFIGPYQVLKTIRSGTSTDVFEALRGGSNKRIALKVLRKKFHKDKEEVRQLKHEANIGTDLDHPNVIKIHEFYNEQNAMLISMELFHAPNMKIVMREKPELIAPNVAPIIRQCAKSLQHLHDRGWVHCDVKPDNYLLNDESVVKLIDFSIAVKLKQGMLGSLLGGRPKHIQGTRSYMAPEQIRRKTPDARTDIYGLGCVVFELMAGRAPYSGTSPDDLLNKHLTASLPSLEAYSGASKDMAALVKKMIAKKPENRFESMAHFLDALKKIQIYRGGKRPEGFVR
jgi:serine/threonine protein kinase